VEKTTEKEDKNGGVEIKKRAPGGGGEWVGRCEKVSVGICVYLLW